MREVIQLSRMQQIILSKIALHEFDRIVTYVYDSVKQKLDDGESIVFISKLDANEIREIYQFSSFLYELFIKISAGVTPEELNVHSQSIEGVAEKMFTALTFCKVLLSSESQISYRE